MLHSAVEDEPFLPLYVLENVNVVEKTDVTLADRLQSLAQRLQALSQTQCPDESRSSSVRRPSSHGVSLLREALWQGEKQQTCSVGNTSPLRPSPQLHLQARLPRGNPPHGTRSSTSPFRLEGHGEPNPCSECDGKDDAGRVMEVRGKRLQQGLTTKVALNMTL